MVTAYLEIQLAAARNYPKTWFFTAASFSQLLSAYILDEVAEEYGEDFASIEGMPELALRVLLERS
jgi:hypothetical protein